MKIPSYASTLGLDQFPKHERFAVYRETHKRLMIQEAGYRNHWNSYMGGIVAAIIATAGPYVGGGPYGIALSVFLPLLAASVVVVLAFRQQKFMNKRIGEVLLRQTT